MSEKTVPLDKPARRRSAAVVLTAALLLVGGGAAWAYWTAAGSGSGTANTGTATEAVRIMQTSVISGLAPGSPPQPLNGTFTNPNASSVYVATLNATISSVTKASGAPTGPCEPGDYSLSGFPLTINKNLPAKSTTETWSGGAIAFNNKPNTNQDGCKGASVTIAYTSE